MRVSKKVKIITLVSIVTVAIVSLACASMNNKTNELLSNQVTKQSISKWQLKAPQLFNNVGFNSLIESGVIDNNLSESMVQLQGVITNPFGIRDDILEYILANTASHDDKLLRASIRLAQSDQQIYYGSNITNEIALAYNKKGCLMVSCISQYMGNLNNWSNYVIGMDKLMRNTKERDKYMWYIDRKYFSWKILGSGLSVADEKIACEKGDF